MDVSLAEAPRHPHHVARGTFADLDGVPVPRTAPRFSRHHLPEPTPVRAAGADTTAYLLAHGFAADEVDVYSPTGRSASGRSGIR